MIQDHGFYHRVSGLLGLLGLLIVRLLYWMDANLGHINQWLQFSLLAGSIGTLAWGWTRKHPAAKGLSHD